MASWVLPYKLTSYRIDARAYTQDGATVATASTTVSTMTPLPCTPYVYQTVTTG